MRRIFRLLLVAAAFIITTAPLIVITPALAASTDICTGIGVISDASGSGSGCADNSGSLDTVVHTVINLFSAIVGLAAVIMIIIGGLKYITSGGDASKLTSAKNTILYALIGLVVAAVAQMLVHFVFTVAASKCPAGQTGLPPHCIAAKK